MIRRNAIVGDSGVYQFQYDAFVKRFVASIPVLKEGRQCHKMQVVCNDVIRGMQYALILNRDEAEIARLFLYGQQLGINSVKIALNPSKAVVLHVGDIDVDVKVDNVSEIRLNAGFWQIILCLSIAQRDEAAIKYLTEIPNQTINLSSAIYDPLDFAVVDVLKSLFDPVGLNAALSSYWSVRERATYPTAARKNFNEYLVVPMIRVAEAFALNDQHAFDKTLEEALTQHAAFYKEERDGWGDPNDAYGWMSFSLIALCIRALDSGLTVNVFSDYIPKTIMRHKFSENDFNL